MVRWKRVELLIKPSQGFVIIHFTTSAKNDVVGINRLQDRVIDGVQTIILDNLTEKRSRELVRIECNHCHSIFEKPKNKVLVALKWTSKSKKTGRAACKYYYCSTACEDKAMGRTFETVCAQCNGPVTQTEYHRNKYPRRFCGSSCAATYNTTHKTHGTRRSKLEAWIEEQLTELYSASEIHFNRKDAINSELDIYFPKLKLAFELNGIFHYEPIYGQEKLSQIQNNDERKSQACCERGIEFCIIDTSALKIFHSKRAQRYLDIILQVLNSRPTQI